MGNDYRASLQVTTATVTLSTSWKKKLEIKAKRQAAIALEQEMKDRKRQEIEVCPCFDFSLKAISMVPNFKVLKCMMLLVRDDSAIIVIHCNYMRALLAMWPIVKRPFRAMVSTVPLLVSEYFLEDR